MLLPYESEILTMPVWGYQTAGLKVKIALMIALNLWPSG
jgi:hypothetical protein